MIVAISGKKFAGKDTCAEGLIRFHKFKRVGLADKLKDLCSEVFSIPRSNMDHPTLKEELFSERVILTEAHINNILGNLEAEGFNVKEKADEIRTKFSGFSFSNVREILQIVGSDLCRNYVADDIWLSLAKKKITGTSSNIVITDARFENERVFLKSIGATLILVKRPGFENSGSHISENDLGNEASYDVVVTNSGTAYELQSNIAMWYTCVCSLK